ncbi:MAG TPA: tail fiber domain-containing protein, partial [Anaerolineae bacterium]
ASGSFATVPGGYLNSAGGAYSFAAGTQARALNPGAFVWSDPHGSFSSTRDDQFLVRASGGITLYTTSVAVDGNSIAAGASLYSGSGSWNNLSNKNLKTNFADVDSRAILERVRELPITTWNYKTQDESIRHIGPMAQDFAAAFKVGENDTTISTVDAQGVALAAIQGLAQENKELKEKNEQELKELGELKERN